MVSKSGFTGYHPIMIPDLKKLHFLIAQALMCIAMLLGMFCSFAGAFEIKPYKEKIFKYRTPIEVGDNGDFLRLPYNVLKDVNGRDQIPVRKVKGYYTSSKPRKHEKDLVISANGRQITYFAVGALSGNATMTVIFCTAGWVKTSWF